MTKLEEAKERLKLLSPEAQKAVLAAAVEKAKQKRAQKQKAK